MILRFKFEQLVSLRGAKRRGNFLLLFLILFVGPTCTAFSDQGESDQLDFAQGLLSRGMYDMAILQYQKFISQYPKSASIQEAYLALGESYFLSQDFDHATAMYNQFKGLYPNSDKLPVSLLRLGEIDIQEKKYDQAIKELTSIDTQKQLKGDMLQSFDFYTGEAYWGQGDATSALAFLQKATQVDGASDYNADAFKKIGEIYTQNGQYPQAMDAYAKSAQLTKDDSLKGELSYKTAEAQFLSGQFTDAAKSFQQVIDQYPTLGFDQDALANLLLAYFNLGQFDQLLDVYQKDIKQVKNDDTGFPIHFAAVLAYIELKNYDQANALLDKLLAFPSLKSGQRAKVFIKKADILIREKKFKDGMALLDAYSSENTNDADETFFLRAQAYYGLGDNDRAFNFFENVYLNFPGSRFFKAALLGQAHAREETGRYKEAEDLFLKCYGLQEDPNLKAEALYNALMVASKAGDASTVISKAEDYLKNFPAGEDYGEVLLILADTYSKNNQLQDAVKLLQGYLAGAQAVGRPNAANFLLGYDEQLLGNTNQALAAYAKVDQHQEDGKFYTEAVKNMAIIYLTQKNYDQARIYFDLLIDQSGQNDLQLKTYIWVCNEYLKQDKYDDVLRVADQAEKKFPLQDLIEIKYFKAEALRAKGSCDEAIKNYEDVLTSPDKNAFTGSAHIGEGLCYVNAKKYDQAKLEFQKALDENADDATVTVHARFEMANLEDSQGDLDDALKMYLLIATIYDDDYFCSESLLRAAKIAEHLNRKEDALKMYSEILEKYKNSTAATYAQGRIGLLK